MKVLLYFCTMQYTLKKSLGQHFLHDENMCRKIVSALQEYPFRQLLEVGPGAGAITKYLIELPAVDFKAVELDAEKVQFLESTYPALRGKLLHQSFLDMQPPFEGLFTVVGNFPYNISTQILFQVVDWKTQVEQVVGMFQKEVAQRAAAPSGSKVYGVLSVLIQAYFVWVGLCLLTMNAMGQSPELLVKQVKQRMDQVKNYVADGQMKTNVSFLKVPQAAVKVYFKQPGKVKIVNEQGISLVPKGAINFSLHNVIAQDGYAVLDAGTEQIDNTKVRVVKLIPNADNSDIVLSTLYIDPAKQVVLRAKTTTRDNGTYELDLKYGSYVSYALPDRVIFTFNTKEYKLPKGLTFDYDDGSEKKKPAPGSNLRGEVSITYKKFIINKGVDDSIFK